MSKLPKVKRDKIILVGMVTVATAAAIWFALINSQRRVLVEVRKQKNAAEQQLKAGQTAITTAENIAQDFQQATARLKVCETGMAASTDMYSWLFETLNKFRLGHQVEIPQFSRETAADVGLFASFPYRAASFTVRGTACYHDFGKFLSAFENEFPYIRVQNIELVPNPDVNTSSGTREKLSFTMDLLTLVRPAAQ